MTSGVLAPLAARYAHWLGLPASVLPSASLEDVVIAMQLVLRIERADPPARTPLLEAAARAAVAVCLDPRSALDGEWHRAVSSWLDGRIRKVARRARGAHWSAVQSLPGITVGHGGAEVRALVPGPVTDLPSIVSRLQVAGTDLPPDDPGPVPTDRPVLWLNPTIPMTTGKAAAQVGHATMIAAALLDDQSLDTWTSAGWPLAVRTAPPTTWASLIAFDNPLTAWRTHRLLAVRDAGFTEIPPGTVTVLAQFT